MSVRSASLAGICRRFLAVILLFGFVAPAAATPPEDFAGNLFIDSSGCVLLRVEGRWQPRLLSDGGRDCGYPPTPIAHRDFAGGSAADLPLPPGMNTAEGRLLVTMAEGGMLGDLVADDTGRTVPDMAPTDPVARELAGAVGPAGAAARMITAGARPNARLCELLGQDGSGDEAELVGADPSRGFCPDNAGDFLTAALRSGIKPAANAPDTGQRAASIIAGGREGDAAVSRPVARRGQSEAAAVPPSAASEKTALAATRPVAASTDGAAASPDSKTHRVAIRARPTDPASRPLQTKDGTMIPAGARYLLVSVDPAVAEQNIARIASLGLPVARGRSAKQAGVLVMAGPFDSREAIVRAHDRLRRAGFGRLIPH